MGGVGWGGLHSHFHVTPNRCVVLCCVGVGVLTISDNIKKSLKILGNIK